MPFIPLVLVALLACPPLPAPTPSTHPLSQPRQDAVQGISITEAYAPEELALQGGYAIAVVTIVTSSRHGTNARPPQLSVRVERALAGRLELAERAAIWRPRPSGVDWSGAGADRLTRAWGVERLPAPKVGERYIALVALDAPLGIDAALRTPWSEAAEAEWRARIDAARTTRSREATEATRAAERAQRAERERVASADLAALVAASDTIVVATLSTLQFSGESLEAVPHASETLRARRGSHHIHLVDDAEVALYTEDLPVLVFARWTRWPSRFGGDIDGMRLVSPRHGILPATPERVAAIRALLAR